MTLSDVYRANVLMTATGTFYWAYNELSKALSDSELEVVIYDVERALESLKALVGKSDELKADPREM